MSPRGPDPRMPGALIEAAAKVLLRGGRHALTARRVAEEAGTSTMAVYTYFTKMDDLRDAVAREGFDRLAQHLAQVEETGDSVADVAALGGAYFVSALTSPDLYHFMFSPDHDATAAHDSLSYLERGVGRAIDAGRFTITDSWKAATELRAMGHGIVNIHFARLLSRSEAIETYSDMGYRLFVGFGDEPAAAQRSIKKGSQRTMQRYLPRQVSTAR